MTDLIEKTVRTTVLGRARSPSHAWAPWIAEAKQALGILATPLIFTQLAQMAIFTTDVIMLGRLSKTALASAAIGNTVFYFAWLVGGGPASAVSPMIAHILGERAGNKGGVRASLRMGLWSVAICSIPMMAVMWFAKPILLALHQDPVLAEGAGKFVGMLSFGLPFSLGYLVLRNFTTALGKPRAGLWVMAATIAFNGLAGYTLIFGHFGAPRLGIVGSGLATAASAMFSFVAMLAIIGATPSLRAYRMFRRFHKPVTVKLAEVFRLGLPIGLSMIFEAMLSNTMTLVMGTFGARFRWPRTRSPSASPRSPSWFRWAWAWPRRCGSGWRPAPATSTGPNARASPPWPWGWASSPSAAWSWPCSAARWLRSIWRVGRGATYK